MWPYVGVATSNSTFISNLWIGLGLSLIELAIVNHKDWQIKYSNWSRDCAWSESELSFLKAFFKA